MKRIIVNHQDGPALIQQPKGVRAFVVGQSDQAELDVDDEQWALLQTDLQTEQLDFDTVKEINGITEVQGD